MRAGKFRHRITFQKPVTAKNDYNEDVITYQGIGSVWASVQPLSGREYFAAQQAQAAVTHRVTARYHRGFVESWKWLSPAMPAAESITPVTSPRMRIVFKGRVFNVQNVIDVDERHRELQFMCVEEVS